MKELFKAVAAFQQECPTIHKGTKGYGYSYADLPAILDVINPLLQKHGLGFTQLIKGQTINTIVFHIESGESIESETHIPQDVNLKGMNEFQVLGSAITYLRRYALSSMLGIVTDKDVDAAGEQVPKKSKKLLPLLPDTNNWTKAVEFLSGNGSLDQIKKKYTLTLDNEKELIKEAIENK